MKNQKPNNRRHFSGYWKKIWSRNRENMTNHINNLNRQKTQASLERVKLVKAIISNLPKEPMTASRLRDQVSEYWQEFYGDEMTTTKAWCLTRLCIKHGLFLRQSNGMYIINVD